MIKITQYTHVMDIETGTLYNIPSGTVCTVVKTNGERQPPKILVSFNDIVDEQSGKPVTGWVFNSVTNINDK